MNALLTYFSVVPWHSIAFAFAISLGAILTWYLARRGFLILCRGWQARGTPSWLSMNPNSNLTRLFRQKSKERATASNELSANLLAPNVLGGKRLSAQTWQVRLHQLLWNSLHIVFWIISLIWGFIALTAVLALFPATQDMGQSLLSMAWNAVSQVVLLIASAIPGLFITLAVVVLAKFTVVSSNRFFDRVIQDEVQTSLVHYETARATRLIVNLLIVLLAIALVYPFLPGSGSDAFKGISFLLGIMITLGSTGVLSQMMCGLVLIYARSLRVGDYVSINQNEGVVREIGLLAVKIINIRNEETTIPHAVLVAHPVHNFSRKAEQQGTMLSTKISIGYDVDWRVVHQLTLSAVDKSSLRKEPKPFILQRSLSDFYVEYELVFSIDNPIERLKILSTLHAHILDAFNHAGVQIMSPHFMTQPSQAVVASSHTSSH